MIIAGSISIACCTQCIIFVLHIESSIIMAQRILVVGDDLDSLSKIYLSLIHRKYSVIVTDKTEEILPRIKRYKPALLILNEDHYNTVKSKIRATTIVLAEKNSTTELNYGDLKLEKPFSMDQLVKLVKAWTI